MPTNSLNGCCPYELLFNKKSDYTFMKSFGCQRFLSIRSYNTNKLQPRFIECIFLGYASKHCDYICKVLNSNKIYINRHVVFHETCFPLPYASFASQLTSISSPDTIIAPLTIPLVSQSTHPFASQHHSFHVSSPSSLSPQPEYNKVTQNDFFD